MKSLSSFICESLVKIKAVRGSKYVKCSNREIDIEYDIKSSKWKTVEFELWEDKYVGYFCDEQQVVFYHKVGTTNWGSAAPFDPITDKTFDDFEKTLMDAATVPEFDKFDTNL